MEYREDALGAIKEESGKWQLGLQDVAWNSIYLCNHDQPRVIARLGDDGGQYRERSAKCIATFLHMMQGTPYIYQGGRAGYGEIIPLPILPSLGTWKVSMRMKN